MNTIILTVYHDSEPLLRTMLNYAQCSCSNNDCVQIYGHEWANNKNNSAGTWK